MYIKKLVICTAFILGFTARPALAECTLNPDISLPQVVALDTEKKSYEYYKPTSTMFYPLTTSLDNFAAKMGIRSDTVLATCTDGESLIIENNESEISGSRFTTTVGGVAFYSGIGGLYNATDFSLFRIPTSTGGRQVTIDSGGEYSLYSIFKYINFGIKLVMYRPSYYTSGMVEQLFLFRVSTSDGKEIASIYINPFYVKNGTCRTNTYDNKVDFDKLSMQSMKSPGATSKVVNFNINISCGSLDITPSITFGGDTDSQNTDVFINSSGEGYSQGIGIQIMRENKVVPPGQWLSLGGGLTVGKDYEFGSRVFRLNDELTAGNLDVPVTFTLAYE